MELNINLHTYLLKQAEAYCDVLKHMHFYTDVMDIEEHRFKVCSINNVKQYKTKRLRYMFFIDLEPNANNENIFNLVYLLNAYYSNTKS